MKRLRIEIIILFLLIGVFVGRIPDSLARKADYSFVDSIVDVRLEVLRHFVNEPNDEKMLEGAINGMIDKLNDPYTVYLSSEALENFDKQTRGTFSGIGAQIEKKDGQLRIVSPLEDSPAFEAGIMAGDIIVEIEGESADQYTLQEAIDRITGPEGTVVKLLIRHPDGEETLVPITRQRIDIQTVKGISRDDDGHWNYMLDPKRKVGYIRITQFSETTAENFKAAIDQLLEDDMQALILDLRFDPGGLLDAAVKIADMFLDEGVIVSTDGRNSPKRTINATSDNGLPDFPMVMLLNEFSASASEVLSGALKDNDRAVVLGTRSFGKGSVQQVVALEGGSGAIKITTAHYYLPSGRNIHRDEGDETWGVDPNDGLYVAMTDEQRREMLKRRRESDVLRREGNGELVEITAEYVREELADPQLGAAIETITGKLTDGQWKQIGGEDATALAHIAERDLRIRQRDLLLERLEEVNQEIDRITRLISDPDAKIDSELEAEQDAAAVVPSEAADELEDAADAVEPDEREPIELPQ